MGKKTTEVISKLELAELRKDKSRLDWLADPANNIGNVQLPTDCVCRNPHSLRDAIDDAMGAAIGFPRTSAGGNFTIP